jgi:hypothetical protein
MKRIISAAVVVLCIGSLACASWTFDVDAKDDSIMAPLDTGLSVSPGQRWIIGVDLLDMWRAGPDDQYGVRLGNADGLGNPYGSDFGFYTYGGSSFRYGTLVGQIDNGSFFEVGTSFDEVATQTGNLKLLYWDLATTQGYADNEGYVTATVTLVPVPGALLLAGLGTAVVRLLRGRRML